MRFSDATETFIRDMRSSGRINSSKSEISYRGVLDKHGDDIANRDPRTVGRTDVKRTLARWQNPNTQRTRRAILVSFYDYAMEEGWRKDNPARQTRRPKRRPVSVYHPAKGEAAAMLGVCRTQREYRAIFLGICAGLRNSELRGLQGRHFARDGWVWVSQDIGKGGKERWVPVLGELAPVVAEIRAHVDLDEYVLPAIRWRNPPENTKRVELRKQPSSSQALRTLVMGVAKRAGIAAHLSPHALRRAFADHVARYAGMRNAQFLMGHESVATTEEYLGTPSLDELAASIRDLRFSYPPEGGAQMPVEATTGIEPVLGASWAISRLAQNLRPLAVGWVAEEAS